MFLHTIQEEGSSCTLGHSGLGPAMSSCSPTVPIRELDSLEESLLVCLCSHSPLVGAFFFYVSGVVTNARSACSDGASVEELTCSKNQRRD